MIKLEISANRDKAKCSENLHVGLEGLDRWKIYHAPGGDVGGATLEAALASTPRYIVTRVMSCEKKQSGAGCSARNTYQVHQLHPISMSFRIDATSEMN